MTRSRYLPLVVAGVALLAAVLVVLLARDVAAWRSSLADGDRRFPGTSTRADLWEPDGGSSGLARALLGVDDDVRVRRAVQLFRRSRPEAGLERTPRDAAFATQAEVVLSEVQRSGEEPAERRAFAANLVGVLALADALTDLEQAGTLLQTSTKRFAAAVELDPGNDAAAANLELALKLLEAQISRVEAEGVQRAGGGSRGAGTGGRRRGF